jgi:hypothetical protein
MLGGQLPLWTEWPLFGSWDLRARTLDHRRDRLTLLVIDGTVTAAARV